MTHRILILGGTTEARQLAGRLARRKDFSVTLSLAGRTESPVAQGVPVRVGGFGGAEGLAAYLRDEQVDLLIDATHPYAARISANATEAAERAGVPILALRRPGWEPVAGDRWTMVDSVAEAASALGTASRRVFLAIGRQEAGAFEAAPQHGYLIRSVDPVDPKLAVPDALYLLARGPFAEADERALLERHGIDAIVSKNSGGEATYGKIAAARALGIEVVIIRRPPLPDVPSAETVDALAAKVDHLFDPVAERGV
ncbi:cobalt-precorrin-6A reductase [Mesorhizobium sp. M2E.F.Ca.ET.209.01.1.1]|uniref:cobalt-precorrin-6A reductase n=1 Tax=Mesorhizobium sp. M2E.F.Ca.ET.209.01.1.1 TaxID=2500526 RepID=UPI000FDA9206|nr:cobalt-precorrin-6A reductase [Mesorhizobium sp. M2E.F.Ca.ET.209.01.1.1]TGS16882.1 cobalt-precorrin-6A reductase [Mesorhizobium sp. M2E.F.Ca.ET.209.01.1.1]